MTNTQVANFRKNFANNLSNNIKTQISKIKKKLVDFFVLFLEH